MNPFKVGGSVAVGLLVLIGLLGSFYVIDPGERGIVVTMGKVPATFSTEGLGFKTPFASSVIRVSVRQQTQVLMAPAFSSDLQQVNAKLQILYRVPESSVIKIYQEYAGNPFDSLIAPTYPRSS